MADDSEADADPSDLEDGEQSHADEADPSGDDAPTASDDRQATDDAPTASDDDGDDVDDATAYTPDQSVLSDDGDDSDTDSGSHDAGDDGDTNDDESETSNDAEQSDSAAESAEETVRALEEAYDLEPVTDESLVETTGTDDDAVDESLVTGEAATDGAAPVGDGDAVDAAAPEVDAGDSFVDEGIAGEGPAEDREMPLADHIEEMIRRLAVVLVLGGSITLLLYPGSDVANWLFDMNLLSASEVIQFLWNTHIPGAPEIADRRPRLYGPLELILTEIKVAGLVGFVLGLPVFVYETYRFMRPGLYRNERRYYLAAVPTSLILALVGVAFAHFVVLPAIFAYFTSYTQGTAVIAFGLRETFNLILILMGYMAIVFQIPLFIMLGIMMNLFTRVWLTEKRLLFWGGFLGLAFLVSPDPTGMAPIIVAATMITLFEGTLLLLRWTGN
jgi:sec-independent protein translocase protein TatC